MKTRYGLVSNSSSSSFVISIRNPDTFKVFGRFTLEELGLAEDGIIRSKEELDSYYSNNIEDIEDIRESKRTGKDFHYYREEALNSYEAAIKEIEKGKVICFGCCNDQDDNVVQRGLCGGGWGDLEVDPDQEMIVIKDCSGY